MAATRRTRQNQEVREFILQNVKNHPDSVAALAVQRFGLSRTTINRYVKRLINEGLLDGHGKTNARQYFLRDIVNEVFSLQVNAHMSEDVVWRFRVLPKIKTIPKNVVDICQYGFTEMLNNVIDHSESNIVICSYQQTYADITILVVDHGVGIFEKIQRDFKLSDPRSALLELSKGKLTSDARRHSGEGVFFTSRMFDQFAIRSGHLCYLRERKDGTEWLIETREFLDYEQGTAITLRIPTDAVWTRQHVFDLYQGDSIGFRKTHVPIKLAGYPGEQLVSRSQAKRLLARFEQFSEVFLDFAGVEQIGQAFADEVFRVFHTDHPEIGLIAVNTNAAVQQTIDNATVAQDKNEGQTVLKLG